MAVIIPLEFHRGISVECIKAWATAQHFPREHFQILIAMPPEFDPELRDEIRSLLSQQDVIEEFPVRHDIALVEAIADRANAELLLFSESHCVPESDALTYLVGLADAHPEWAAISAPTIGMAGNMLAEIERDIYAENIHRNLNSHAWLRVLDQCFLIRRDAYVKSAGFRGEFGHFAEWLLAASMKVRGLKSGIADRAVVHHKYIGDCDELEEFTTDFAYGQIKYLDQCAHEAEAALFPKIPELEDFRRRTDDERRRPLEVARQDFSRVLTRTTVKTFKSWQDFFAHRMSGGPVVRHASRNIAAAYAYWSWKRQHTIHSASGKPGLDLAESHAKAARRSLERAIARSDKAAARNHFVEWFARLVRQGRMAYLSEIEKGLGSSSADRTKNFPRSGVWWVGHSEYYARVFDVYDVEETQYGEIRWTRPILQSFLPLHPGRQRIVLEWAEARPIEEADLLSVHFDGHRLERGAWRLEPCRLFIDLDVSASGWKEVLVSVCPFQAANDGRLLGLPLRRIVWLSEPFEGKSPAKPENENQKRFYFLHVPKCAGTSIATCIADAFPADALFSRYCGTYYPYEYEFHPRRDVPSKLYIGHFGWSVPASQAGQGVRISTIVREPVERLISNFHYKQQLDHIDQRHGFDQWVQSKVAFWNTMTPHFVAQPPQSPIFGVDAVVQTSRAYQEEAIANLRSCKVVGLTEHIEDTINLLAIEMEFLPPRRMARYNATKKSRPAALELDASLRATLESLLRTDIAIYDEAKRLFSEQVTACYTELLGSIPEDATEKVRSLLRQRFLERMRDRIAGAPEPAEFSWNADDALIGENCHQREHDGKTALRWTGPGEETYMVLPIGQGRSWQIEFLLHPATPDANIEGSCLRYGDLEIRLEAERGPYGVKLSAQLPARSGGCDALWPVEFSLMTRTCQEQHGFRPIGVALIKINAAHYQ